MAKNRGECVRLLQKAHRAHAPPKGRRDARVTYKLGYCYWDGIGVEPNREEGLRLYVEAARMGYMRAMYRSGYCKKMGFGVERDLVEAAHWLRRAAALGHKLARSQMKQIQRRDAEAANPYGEWEPRWEVHQWVSQKVRQEMVTALLVCKRFGIPKVVAVHCLLPFICSLPH